MDPLRKFLFLGPNFITAKGSIVLVSILLASMIGGLALSPVYGQAQRLTFPLAGQLISVPCTNDNILVTSGYMQIIVQGFESDDGTRRHSVTNVNLVGVTGVGQFTDIQYQIRSAAHETSVYHGGQEARTVTGTTNLFIEGGGVDGRSHITAHYTINPNGQLTVDFVNEAGGCR